MATSGRCGNSGCKAGSVWLFGTMLDPSAHPCPAVTGNYKTPHRFDSPCGFSWVRSRAPSAGRKLPCKTRFCLHSFMKCAVLIASTICVASKDVSEDSDPMRARMALTWLVFIWLQVSAGRTSLCVRRNSPI